MKDNAKRMTRSAANAAHTMPKVDAIFAARSFDWAIVDGECHRVTLSQRHDFRSALHARALLGDDEFTSSEIAVGFGQKNRDLKRKHEVSDTKRDCKPSVLFEEFATGFLCGSQRAILCRLEGRSYAQILWLAGSQSGCAVLLPRNIRSKKVHLAS